jgi:hapalindole biogenesis HpiC1 cyclase-like protein
MGAIRVAAPNLVTFRRPTVGSRAPTGQSFTGWTVVGATGVVSVVSGTFQSQGFTFNAKVGAQWIDLTGPGSKTATGVAQSIATTPGTSYQLSLWVGNVNDPGGIFGVSSTVKVRVNGVLKLTAVNSLHPTNHKQAWKEFTLTIKASSSHTKISFINGDPGTDDSNGLDAVHLS